MPIEKLNSSNFFTWKVVVQMLLKREGLWRITTGEEKKPNVGKSTDDGTALQQWVRNDEKAISTICLAMGTSELMNVRNCETTAVVWKRLAEIYEAKGVARTVFIRRRLYSTRKQEGDSMQEHINKITELVEQLIGLDDPITERSYALTLLSSLPSEYDPLVMTIESMDNNLTPDYVKDRLLHEEA